MPISRNVCEFYRLKRDNLKFELDLDSQDPDIKKAWFYLFLLQYSIVYLVIQVELFKKKSKNKQTQPMSQKNPLMNSNQIELIAILISFSG